MLPIYEIIFFVFAAILIAAATLVILCRNPVHAILFLVLAFFSSAVLWMMMQAEFLSLLLIFVYVGAVMTLFLFVIMMLNIDIAEETRRSLRVLLLGFVILLTLVATIFIAISQTYFGVASIMMPQVTSDFSNIETIGALLYTHYLLPFEIAAVILLVAIIAAITLAFQGRKHNTRTQRIKEQLEATRENRLRVVKMKVEKA